MAAAPRIQHPQLGSVTGVRRFTSVDQFLGIQFATLSDRFARGKLVEKYPESIDATKYPPLPVGNPQACDIEHILIQHELAHPQYTFSDTESLTVDISVPSAEVRQKAGRALPVIFFNHGGGFATGSAHWPQWDMATLVEESIKSGSAVVAVSVSYRIGAFGFLNSAALREAGYRPNRGLHDQELGLRWTQKYVQGFGGDPTNVTFLGSSIGATSGFVHLQSKEPLFAKLVAIGGSPLLQPTPPPVSEMAYEAVTQAIGITSLTPEDQVRALLEMPFSELWDKASTVPVPISYVVDGDVVKGLTHFSTLADPKTAEALYPGLRWCKTVLVGDNQYDGMVLVITALSHRTDDLGAALERCLTKAFGNTSTVSSVLSAYGVTPGASNDANQAALIRFMTDVAFAQAAKACAQAWARGAGNTAYLTHFNCPNPWPGAFQGHATHGLDMAFLLGNYAPYLAPGQRAVRARMARDVITLANGGQPFRPVADGAAMVYYAPAEGEADESELVVGGDGGRLGRRDVLETAVGGRAEELDKFTAALGMFLAGQ